MRHVRNQFHPHLTFPISNNKRKHVPLQPSQTTKAKGGQICILNIHTGFALFFKEKRNIGYFDEGSEEEEEETNLYIFHLKVSKIPFTLSSFADPIKISGLYFSFFPKLLQLLHTQLCLTSYIQRKILITHIYTFNLIYMKFPNLIFDVTF